MATDQLFDLFTLDETGNGSQPEGANGGGGVKALLEAMPELWDESQYASEYNMDTYGGPWRDRGCRCDDCLKKESKALWNYKQFIDT